MTIEDQPFFFHAKHYRATNPDLEQLSDEELLRHFYERGIDEGRAGHRYSFRDKLIALAQQHDEILEIGPFFAPCLEGPQVTYFDVLGKQDLIRRALELGYDTDRIPEIDYVSPTGDLSIIDRRFPALLSSHCIEHQPDLIAHLQKTYALLEPGGCYYLMIPDKRFCYDHFLGESNLAEVLSSLGWRSWRVALGGSGPANQRGDPGIPGGRRQLHRRPCMAIHAFELLRNSARPARVGPSPFRGLGDLQHLPQ